MDMEARSILNIDYLADESIASFVDFSRWTTKIFEQEEEKTGSQVTRKISNQVFLMKERSEE